MTEGGKRRANKSLKQWVAFVKKVAKEEGLEYREAMMRAKARSDKGEKWQKGGEVPCKAEEDALNACKTKVAADIENNATEGKGEGEGEESTKGEGEESTKGEGEESKTTEGGRRQQRQSGRQQQRQSGRQQRQSGRQQQRQSGRRQSRRGGRRQQRQSSRRQSRRDRR